MQVLCGWALQTPAGGPEGLPKMGQASGVSRDMTAGPVWDLGAVGGHEAAGKGPIPTVPGPRAPSVPRGAAPSPRELSQGCPHHTSRLPPPPPGSMYGGHRDYFPPRDFPGPPPPPFASMHYKALYMSYRVDQKHSFYFLFMK